MPLFFGWVAALIGTFLFCCMAAETEDGAIAGFTICAFFITVVALFFAL
jgi:hypothetical protein